MSSCVAGVGGRLQLDRFGTYDVFEFTLTGDQMARIAAMDTGTFVFFDHATRR